ncbi:MAG: hypothetical protein HW421_5 [Ignavibacteria bacterium]|nr:hypothetical protein [Ignavibacteria bacterium]
MKTKQNINYLELVPYQRSQFETKPDGLVDIIIPRFKSKFLQQMLLPKRKSPYLHANLDIVGSAVWLLIDGKKTVEEITLALEKQLVEKLEKPAERVVLFLTQLHRNNFIEYNGFEKNTFFRNNKNNTNK